MRLRTSSTFKASGRLNASTPEAVSLWRKPYSPHRISKAPSRIVMTTTSVLRRSVLAEITCTAPRVPTISKAIRPECFAPSDRPKAKPARLTSSQCLERRAWTAKRTAVAESSATGRSVNTIGRCAETVGSIARKATVPIATALPTVRDTAKARNRRSRAFKQNIAARVRCCTRSGSF